MSYTLQIVLHDRSPKNERTIQINSSATFVDLAEAICTLYGFTGEHLREFIQKNRLCINHPEINIEEPIDTAIFADDPDANDPELLEMSDNTVQVSSRGYRLDQYFTNEKIIVFAYDFLAGWQFTITKIAEDKKTVSGTERTVLSGNGSCLLEDCGGPEGLQEQLALFKTKKYDEDARESFDDFAAWIQPALKKFTIS